MYPADRSVLYTISYARRAALAQSTARSGGRRTSGEGEGAGKLQEPYAMETIERVARLANAHDFISQFPDGYDTLVGERGTR